MANLSPHGSSLRSVTLLTPPQSPSLSEDVPFKPADDDKISLSMKKGHHGHKQKKNAAASRRKLNRTCLSSEELRTTPPPDTQSPRPFHSRSLPSLSVSITSFPPLRPEPPTKVNGTGSPDQRRRRWTLPSKAAPVRSRAVTISAQHKPAAITPPDDSGLLSPAMITLRRATTVRTTNNKRMSLTFFPEPKFERSRTGFLTAFLRTVTGMAETSKEVSWPRVEGRRPSVASIDSEGAQPSHRGSASTVCTKVENMQPTFSPPSAVGQQPVEAPSLRRCSTKYITANQVYEVIWDENASSNSEPTPASEQESGAHPIGSRRQSIAMCLLENQLMKATAQSRRQSEVLQEQEEERRSSFNAAYERQRQGSVQSVLAFKLSRFVNSAALQNLPRSKSSRMGKGKTRASVSRTRSAIPDGILGHPELEQPGGAIEFFPPLRSRATTTGSKAETETLIEAPSVVEKATFSRNSPSMTPPFLRGPTDTDSGNFGSMIGASSHIRRRSTAPVFYSNRKKRSGPFDESRRASAMGMPTLKTTVEDETTPLLSSVGMLE